MKVYPVFKRNTQQKIELILKASNQRNYLLWLVGTHTGLRVSDILLLKVSDLVGNTLSIREKKTSKLKTIKLSSKLKEALNNYINNNNLQESQYIFTSRQSKGSPMTRQRVHQIIKRVAELLGIPDNISTHSLRKTFAYNLYTLSNNNIALVMEALNHSKEVITLRYLCIRDNLLNDILELL